jgi:peptidoglycan hydrolase-like protein with peptidoglycan-binding domain
LIRTQTIILRAAGGLLFAGGLYICAMAPAVLAQSTAAKSTSSAAKTPAKSASTSSQTKKPAATVKTGSTSAAAKKRAATSARTAKSRMQMAPTADRIMEIQTALAASDSYKGEPTGKWDDSSVAAMKHFQQVNGLNPSGKLDALSLQKLGLGSDTAGRGAPRPAKPAGSAPSSTTPSIQR